MFGYPLSAALYLQIAEQELNRKFDFYFLVVSKEDFMCTFYKLSAKTRQEGSAQLRDAMALYKQCKASGLWQLPQTIVEQKLVSNEIVEV
jgi:hypothetical protein